ncbi:glycosyltransferase family 4 protein, partial [bacterium]|nr:glycosyltransferase family 4 protein [bacterium]
KYINRLKARTLFYFCFEGFSKLGDINNHICETVSWLAKFGHEVHFFNPKITSPEFDAKVNIHLVPIIHFPLLNWVSFDIISFFVLIKIVLKNRPDYIYFRETSSLVPLFISKLFSIPLIIEINGWVLSELRQTRYSKWKLFYVRLIQRINYVQATRLIPVSEGLKKLVLKHYPVKSSNIFPVSNGTNPEKFKPIPQSEARKQIGISNDSQIVGFIGSCYSYHGIQYLIKAAKLVLQEKPETKFIIAGDGAQRKEWIDLTWNLNINNSFSFPGVIPFTDAPYYINSYDICIAPWDIELYNKTAGSPMKLFDYLACGKPVIVSPVYGVYEIVKKYNCGVVVDVKNSKLFSKTLLYLIENSKNRKEMGKRGRDIVLKHFTWEITSRKIEKVLREIR